MATSPPLKPLAVLAFSGGCIGLRALKILLLITAILLMLVETASAVSPPSGIGSYIPFTLQNQQSVGTSNPFQQLITVNSLAYQSFEAANLMNEEFFYANGLVIPSWIESNNSNSATVTNIWVSINAIPATSNEIIYFGWANTANDLLTGGSGAGEAAQFLVPASSNTIDNCATVFLSCTNFANAITMGVGLPSPWFATTGAVGTVSLDTNNALITPHNGNDNGITETAPASFTTAGDDIDAKLDMQATGGSITSINEQGISMGAANQNRLFNGQPGFSFGAMSSTSNRCGMWGGSTATGTIVNCGTGPLAVGVHIWTIVYRGISAPSNGMIDYNSLITINSVALSSTVPVNVFFTTDNAEFPAAIQWIRSRSNPPNNVMPLVSPSPVVGLSTPINPKIENGQTVILTANVVGLGSPYSYQWYSGTSPTGTLINGATSQTYAAAPTSNTNYYVSVTDNLGVNQNSLVDSVNVFPILALTLIPTNTPLDIPQTEKFTLSATGGIGPFSVALTNITNFANGNWQQQQNGNVIISSGGSNTIVFTASQRTSVTLPASIGNYVLVSFANPFNSATTSNFQELVTINASLYSNWEASNLDNGEFFYRNGTVIPSDLFGNSLNMQQTTNLNTANSVQYVIRLNHPPPPNNYTKFNATYTNNTNHPALTGVNGQLADPSGVRGLCLRIQPNSNLTLYQQLITDVSPDKKLGCVDFILEWKYLYPNNGLVANWTYLSNFTTPWINNGIPIEFNFYQTSYGGSSQDLPTWLVNQNIANGANSNSTACTGSGNSNNQPIFWLSSYNNTMKQLEGNVLNRYRGNTSVIAIRFGMGIGDEDYPLASWVQNPNALQSQCITIYTSNAINGNLQQTWKNYSVGLLNYWKSLNPTQEMLVTLDTLNGSNFVPKAVATTAINNSESFDIEAYAAPNIVKIFNGNNCNNWCNYTNQYQGLFPLALQESGPSGLGNDMNQKLANGIWRHAQLFELFAQDWATLDDPAVANYSSSSATYNSAFTRAANVIGWRNSSTVTSKQFNQVNTSLNIYFGWASKSTNLMNGVNVGESPILSLAQNSSCSTYDDGANVFVYWQSFCGLGGLPSGYTSSSGTSLTYGTTNLMIANPTGNSGANGIEISSPISANSNGYVTDAYMNATWGNGWTGSIGTLLGTTDGSIGVLSSTLAVVGEGGNAPSGLFGQMQGGGGVSIAPLQTVPAVYSYMFSNSLDTGNFLINFKSFETLTHVSTHIGKNLFVATPNSLATSIYWIDTRVAPPVNAPDWSNIGFYVVNSTSTGSSTYPGVLTQKPTIATLSYEAIAYDQGSANTITLYNSSANTIIVYPTLDNPTITKDKTNIDGGQSIVFTANIAGGTPPYTYNFLLLDSTNGNAIAANLLYTGVFTTTNVATIAMPYGVVFDGDHLLGNVVVTDSASTPVTENAVNTSIIYYHALLSNIVVTPSKPAIDIGQMVTFTITESGGTGGYTYNFLLFNSVTLQIIANQLGSSFSFIFASNSNLLGNTIAANGSVTDSATVPETNNSIASNPVKINALPNPSFSLSNTLIDQNQYITFTTTPLGTPPYTFNFLVISSNAFGTTNTPPSAYVACPVFSSSSNNVQACTSIQSTTNGLNYINQIGIDFATVNNGEVAGNIVNLAYDFASGMTPSNVNTMILSEQNKAPSNGLALLAIGGQTNGGAPFGQATLSNVITNSITRASFVAATVNAVEGKSIANGGLGTLPYNGIEIDFEWYPATGEVTFNGMNSLLNVLESNLTPSVCVGGCTIAIVIANFEIHNGPASFNINSLVPYLSGSKEQVFDTFNDSVSNVKNLYVTNGIPLKNIFGAFDLASTDTSSYSNTITIGQELPQYVFNGMNVGFFSSFFTRGNEVVYNDLAAASTTYQGNSILANQILANQLYTNVQTSSNSFTFNSALFSGLYVGNSFKANVIVTDNTLVTASSPYVSFGWNGVLSFTDPVLSNSIVPLNSYQMVSQNVIGGTVPYYYGYNVIAPNGMLVTNVIYVNSIISNTFFYQHLAAWGSGTFTVNTFVKDSATSPSVVTNSLTYSAVGSITSAALSATNTLLDFGQTEVFTATVSGGAAPYSYNYLIVNAVTGAILANYLVSNSYTSNTFVITPGFGVSNTIEANVTIIDGASQVANTVDLQLGYNAFPSATPTTPVNPHIDSGQTITYTSHPTLGTAPYQINWFSNGACTGGPFISGSTYITSSPPAVLTYQMVDSATTNAVSCSTPEITTINATPTVSLVVSNTVLDSSQWYVLTATVTGGTPPFDFEFNNYTSNPSGTGIYIGAPYPCYDSISGYVGVGSRVYACPRQSSSPTNGNVFTYNVLVIDSSAAGRYGFNALSLSTTVDAQPYVQLPATPGNFIIFGNSVTTNAFILNGTGTFTFTNTINGVNYQGTILGTNSVSNVLPATQPAGTYTYQVRAVDTGTTTPFQVSATSNVITIFGVITSSANVFFQNTISNNRITIGSGTFSGSTYYPYQIYGAPQSGVSYNVYLNKVTYPDIKLTTSQTLSAPLYAHNVVISGGVVLTTNGYPILASGVFTNNGIIYGGQIPNSGGATANAFTYSGNNALNLTRSYGGTGGAGGSPGPVIGGYGGNALVLGGIASSGNGGNGNTGITIPSLTNANALLYESNILGYLSSTGGGSGGFFSAQSGGAGANGVYGVYIQAATVANAGPINVNGTGIPEAGVAACGGASGGAAILIAYGAGGYTSGTYNTLGSAFQCALGSDKGGTGGNGQVATFNYATPPVNIFTLQNIPLYLGVPSFNSILAPTNASGVYDYMVNSVGSISASQLLNITVNMTDIANSFVLSNMVQYTPVLATLPAGSFTSVPTKWNIWSSPSTLGTYTHYNISQLQDVLESGQLTLPTKIQLIYPFTTFNLSLQNNPQVQSSFSFNAWTWVSSNTLPALYNQRNSTNTVLGDEQLFTPVFGTTTSTFTALFNNYTIPANINGGFSANQFQIYGGIGSYQNPVIAFSNYTIQSSASGYFPAVNYYCPFNQQNPVPTNLNPYLVNANGLFYSFSVGLANGNPALNYYLVIQTPQSSSNLQVQSYKVSSASFSLPLEVGQLYRFQVYNPQCSLVYTGSYASWNSPIGITLNGSASGTTTIPAPAPGNFINGITHSCSTNPMSGNIESVACNFTVLNGTKYNTTLVVTNAIYANGTTIGVYTVCNGIAINQAANTLSCNVGNTNSTLYTYAYYLTNNGVTYLLQHGTFGQVGSAIAGFAIFFALLIFCAFAFLYVTKNPTLTILGMDIGITIISLLNYISTSVTIGLLGFWYGLSIVAIYLVNKRK